MKKKTLVGTLLIITSILVQAQPFPSDDSLTHRLSLLFIGDIMGHSPQIVSAYDSTTKGYNYEDVFQRVKPVFEGYDIAIANLEVTLAGKPFTGYPQFSSPDELALALKNSGIDILVTANNHSVDRGKKGIIRTVQVLDSIGIPHTGTFLDSIHRDTVSPLIIEKNGIRVALLNYTYGTNGLAVPYPALVNLIDTSLIRFDFTTCKAKGADEVIAFFHWGMEYERSPNPDQKELAAFCHRMGIRIVIGSHPHVIQRMEASLTPDSITSEVTVYSLGNFVSNQRGRYRNGGAVAGLTLRKDSSGISIDDTGYRLVWVYTPVINGRKMFQILPVPLTENQKNLFKEEELTMFDEFVNDTRQLLNSENINFPELTTQSNSE